MVFIFCDQRELGSQLSKLKPPNCDYREREICTNSELISRSLEIVTAFTIPYFSFPGVNVTSQVTSTHKHTHTHTHTHAYTLRKHFSGSACDLMSAWRDDVVGCCRRPSSPERVIEGGKRDTCAPHVLSVLGKGWTRKALGQSIGHILTILRPSTLQQLRPSRTRSITRYK